MNQPTPGAMPAARGTVYGCLLNHPGALAALGAAVHQPPYKAPPRAPVLYIKPRNTWLAPGQAVRVPEGVAALEVGATLGMVIGHTACQVNAEEAMHCVAGYVLVNDVSMPHASYYRPSLRFNARDTFCPIGPFVPRAAAPLPDAVAIEVWVDGVHVHSASMAGLVRPAAQLLAAVAEFMTLSPGDVLCLGVAAGAPQVRAGQHVRIHAPGIGSLENPFVAEGTQP